uniref:Uncharacterized protein n=1 Tax=Nostoc sp. PCC 9448 TaxID=2099384 RepID=A0A2P0ZGK5_9NOSO|nr:hypothetical protein [Nostoc sp. PCC 9448]
MFFDSPHVQGEIEAFQLGILDLGLPFPCQSKIPALCSIQRVF